MRFFSILTVSLIISSTSFADDFFNPPPLNPELPPWMQDNTQPAQPQQAQPVPDASAPPPAEAVPFDGGSEGDEEASPFDFGDGGGGGGGSGRGSDQGKDNFQILDKVERSKSGAECVGWGSSFLGTKVFTSESFCRAELDQELENARDAINNYSDHTEKEVLRSVIKGKVSREKSKDFHLQFDSIKGAISLAGKTGCKCLE